jgi:DNA relaxase NicK
VSDSLHEMRAVLTGARSNDDLVNELQHIGRHGFADRNVADSLDRLAKRDGPPSNNMGGNLPFPPPIFSHGEKLAENVVQKTKLDWIAFTSSRDVPELEALVKTIWPKALFARNGKGMFGYPESQMILVDEVQIGMMGFGAEHGRNYVSLPGTACKMLNDELIQLFYDCLTLQLDNAPGIFYYDAKLTRLDICLDFFRGELTWDHAFRAYDLGAFKGSLGGRNPKKRVIDESADGRNLGRTLYIGTRGGNQYARIYEKGLEVFAKLPENLREISHAREEEMGGVIPHADDWLRLEVEFGNASKDRILPFEMMLHRDKYFAGSFPYFADALGLSDGLRPKTLKTDLDVDLFKLIYNAKRSYGSLVHSLTQLGFTDTEIRQELSSGRNNNKLIRSGLMSKLTEIVKQAGIVGQDSDIPF